MNAPGGQAPIAPGTRARVAAVWLLAAAVLALAWPRLRATALYLPVDTALERHRAGEPIDSAQLRALAERAERAFAAHPQPRYLEGASRLQYELARSGEAAPEAQRAALERSAASARDALRLAPMRPDAWLRLGLARASLERPVEEVLPALLQSVYAGRVEPTLMLPRLEALYRYWPRLNDEGRQLLLDQTLLAWQMRPRQVAARVRAGALPYAGLADLLAPRYPHILDELDRRLGWPAR